MIEGLIIFALGYVCGKYTDQVISFCKNIYDKYFNKTGN
jgi:hypothetical protein